jgi:hypothetical protein
MRKTLLAAVALAPLWFLASQPAAAQTTISSSTSAPLTTAQDGDITINSGGSITPNQVNSAAVTLNSNNSVTNSGTIHDTDVNNAVGVAAVGGNTGSVTNTTTGTISIVESYQAADTNNDGVVESPFASTTSSGRYGIQLTGTSALVGTISNFGAITVQGNSSYGISVEAPLQGDLIQSGTISLVGDNGEALRETKGVTGTVLIEGNITATGYKTNAADLSGDVGGRVSVYSTLSTTDFATNTRATDPTLLNTIQGVSTEVNPNSGSALLIGGNVAGGVFLGAPPANTNATDTVTDADGDGIVDSAETASAVHTFGNAPAILIGSATKDITLSAFDASGAHDNNYGLIIEGAVAGFGLFDNVVATGLQIGGLSTSGATTTLAGGLKVTGSVEAVSYGADATAIHIGAGAVVPTLENTGTISASISPPNTTTSTIPSFTASATAIQIDAGGAVTKLINSGTITAVITGDKNDSLATTALVDNGGALSSVLNTGQITSTFVADATGATVNGQTVALDLHNNTTGVTLTQQQAPTQVVTTTTTNSVTTSVTTTTPAATGTLTIVTVPTVTTSTSGSTTVTTTVPASPSIGGDVLLGNGVNTVNLLAGTITGALSLGAGSSSSFTIDNGAIYTGALTYAGAALALNINNGVLDNLSASASSATGVAAAYNLSSLKVGSTGQVFFGVDPVNNRAAEFLVSGAANFASGAKIGLNFISNATAPETLTLVQAGSLSIGETDTALTGAIPYMFNATVQSNVAAGTITATISPKTAAELGLNPSQTAALPATYLAITKDPAVQSAFLGQFTKTGFLGVYNQVLPDYAGGIFQTANAASLAIGRATSESNDIENPTGSRGAWAQEIFVGVNQGSGQTDGFQGGGFGFVGGVETGGSGLGAFGTTLAFVSTSVSDPHEPGDAQTALSELELGGYWQGEFDGLVADARVGAGYTWMSGRREFVQTNDAGEITLDRRAKSDWNGYTLSGRFGLAYRWSLNDHFLGGGWFIQPQTHLDYFMLNENAYTEDASETINQLALAISSREGQETSGTATVVFGRKIGTGIVWRPSFEVGVRDVFTGDAGDTTARYLSGGPSFTLTPADIQGAAGIARVKIKASSEYYELGLEAGGEVLSSRYEEGDIKASIRVLF